MSIVYLNGEYLPQNEAKISVMDRGFLFADSVYEVIPLFAGHLLGLDAHLKRLEHSLAGIFLTPPLSAARWQEIINELLTRNSSSEDCNIYLQVTRGAAENRSHAIPGDIQPTVLACIAPAKNLPLAKAKQGFSAISLEDSRRRDCYIKATGLLPNILAYEEAHRQGALEAILIRDGYAMECTSSNLFIVKDGVIITPPLSRNILGGTTRNLILAIAKAHDMPYQEAMISFAELKQADEIWVTGSSKEICPIIQLDARPVGNGKVGPVWETVREYYEGYKARRELPENYVYEAADYANE